MYLPKRTTPYITQFFNRDRLAFTSMTMCGHCSSSHLKECGLANSRINNYVRDGLVERVAYVNKGKAEYCYKLTKAGREVAERNWALKSHYHSQSPKHDLTIANKYFSLEEKVRSSWLTETQARELLVDKIHQLREQGQIGQAISYEQMLDKGLLSSPDGIYTNEHGETIAFEVITNNYGEAEIQAKEAFTEVLGVIMELAKA